MQAARCSKTSGNLIFHAVQELRTMLSVKPGTYAPHYTISLSSYCIPHRFVLRHSQTMYVLSFEDMRAHNV